MRVLIFHGYLLRGTGSNVYNAELAQALARLGHEVHLLCQDRDADLGDGVTITSPDIGDVLPVYVSDHYDGFEAKTFLECTDAEIERYVAANVAAVRAVAAELRPDVALANHAVMGPAILARSLDGRVPYAVKIHGSALEYVVKRDPERFGPYAREGLAGAGGVLVGSLHTAESLWAALPGLDLPARTRLGPPGVDVELFAPRELDVAAGNLDRLAQRLKSMPHAAEAGSFARDEAAAGRALATLRPALDRLVVFVGKLIVSKGVDLLAAAWPLVHAAEPDARLVIVGFGAYREGFEALLAALDRGDLDAVRALAEQGRAAEGGPRGPLSMLLEFLDAAPEGYAEAARRAAGSVTVVGRLDHDELASLLPLCDAQVVPSTFPEAFGMVAAEAAACGVLPVVAAHSGLAEVAGALAAEVPPEVAPMLSFEVGPGAVEELAGALRAWLAAPEEVRAQARQAIVRVTREKWSWDGVARSVVSAAEGRLDELPLP